MKSNFNYSVAIQKILFARELKLITITYTIFSTYTVYLHNAMNCANIEINFKLFIPWTLFTPFYDIDYYCMKLYYNYYYVIYYYAICFCQKLVQPNVNMLLIAI